MSAEEAKQMDENGSRVPSERSDQRSTKSVLRDITNVSLKLRQRSSVGFKRSRSALATSTTGASAAHPPARSHSAPDHLIEESQYRSKALSGGFRHSPATIALLNLSEEMTISPSFMTALSIGSFLGGPHQNQGIRVCSVHRADDRLLSAAQRVQIADALLFFGRCLNLPPQAPHMAMGLVDRALSPVLAATALSAAAAVNPSTQQPCAAQRFTSISRLELAGSALQLVRKRLMPDSPGAEDVQWLLALGTQAGCDALTEESVAASIGALEQVLQDADIPSARSYLDRFRSDYPDESVVLAACLLDRCLLERHLQDFPAPLVACAALYLAHTWFVWLENHKRARRATPRPAAPLPQLGEVLSAARRQVPTLTDLSDVKQLQSCVAAVKDVLLQEQFRDVRAYVHDLLVAMNEEFTLSALLRVLQRLLTRRPSSPDPFSFRNPGGRISEELQAYHDLLPLLLLHMESVLLEEERRDVFRPIPGAFSAGPALSSFPASDDAAPHEVMPIDRSSPFLHAPRPQCAPHRAQDSVLDSDTAAAPDVDDPCLSQLDPVAFDWEGFPVEEPLVSDASLPSSGASSPARVPHAGLTINIPPYQDDVALELLFPDHELDDPSLLSSKCPRTSAPSARSFAPVFPAPTAVPTAVPTAALPAAAGAINTSGAATRSDELFLFLAHQVDITPSIMLRGETPAASFQSGASAVSVSKAAEGGADGWLSSVKAFATPAKAISPRVRSKYQLVTPAGASAALESESVLSSAIRHVQRLSPQPRAVRRMHGDLYRILVVCAPCSE